MQHRRVSTTDENSDILNAAVFASQMGLRRGGVFHRQAGNNETSALRYATLKSMSFLQYRSHFWILPILAFTLIVLYSPPAACEDEASESNTEIASFSESPADEANKTPDKASQAPENAAQETQEATVEPSEEVTHEPQEATSEPLKSPPDFRRQVLEQPPRQHQIPEYERRAAVSSTLVGASSGGLVGWSSATIVCFIAESSGEIVSQCIVGPILFGAASGIVTGYMGYKNDPSTVIAGSAIMLTFAGYGILERIDAGSNLQNSVTFLTVVGGGYLGYRLWRIRSPDQKLFSRDTFFPFSASLTPYRQRDRTGLVLSVSF